MIDVNNTILSHTVTKKEEGKNVETILKKIFSISSGLFTNLKLNGKIYINNIICRSIDKPKSGDIVSVDVSENAESDIPLYDIPINVLYEDGFILVSEKPAGLSMHPCIANYEKTFAGAVLSHYKKNGEMHLFHAVNRLDKDTSGICLIAKNRYAHGILSEQMKKNSLNKEYIAVVHGKISSNGKIDLPIEREEESLMKRIVTPLGKPSITLYNSVNYNDKYSIIQVKLLTGRTHQIRVHFSHLGHPLYGDWLYGDGDNERNLIDRQALHSYKISFYHPLTNEHIELISEYPEDIINLINRL